MKKVLVFLIWLLTIPIAQAQPPARVVVDPVTEKQIAKTNQMLGVLEFDKRSGISPEVAGLIEQVILHEGMQVKKGDLLVRLNTDLIRKSITIRTREAGQAEIRIQNTGKNLARYERLFNEAAASEKAYEDLADQLREYRKQHEIIRTHIEKQQLELAKSAIRAPYSGIILAKYSNEGEWVTPGSAVCLIGSTRHVIIKVAVSEDLIRFIRVGDPIYLRVHAVDREFQGKVLQIVPVADPATKTFQVKISIPFFPSAIQNMSATVHVPVSNAVKLRMIKRDALIQFQGKDFVYTVKDGKAAILPVNIVVFSGEYVGVDNPYIVPGMPVVIDGNDRLRRPEFTGHLDGTENPQG